MSKPLTGEETQKRQYITLVFGYDSQEAFEADLEKVRDGSFKNEVEGRELGAVAVYNCMEESHKLEELLDKIESMYGSKTTYDDDSGNRLYLSDFVEKEKQRISKEVMP